VNKLFISNPKFLYMKQTSQYRVSAGNKKHHSLFTRDNAIYPPPKRKERKLLPGGT